MSYTAKDKRDLDLFFRLIEEEKTFILEKRHWICLTCPEGHIYHWSIIRCPTCERKRPLSKHEEPLYD